MTRRMSSTRGIVSADGINRHTATAVTAEMVAVSTLVKAWRP